nr:MAG TPA: hypothetical protein [Caudoviricetes sp.]
MRTTTMHPIRTLMVAIARFSYQSIHRHITGNERISFLKKGK